MAKVIEKIRNKINSNPSLYIFIIFSEITYLAVFFGILLGFGCIRPMGDMPSLANFGFILLLCGILFFLLVHITYIIMSLFKSEFRKIAHYIVLMFLLKLFLIFFAFNLFAHFS